MATMPAETFFGTAAKEWIKERVLQGDTLAAIQLDMVAQAKTDGTTLVGVEAWLEEIATEATFEDELDIESFLDLLG